MDENEAYYEQLLRIRTTGRDASHSDQYIFPYEATAYSVLERLAGEGCIGKKNLLVDYGCGKGRVGFYLAWQTKCHVLGIEVEPRLYETARTNKESAVSGNRVELICAGAENVPVPENADRFFFFNPFSEEILKKVMTRILASYYEKPREILLFFYYPSDEYIPYLCAVDELLFEDEIDCRDLFPGNDPREKIMIFRIGE